MVGMPDSLRRTIPIRKREPMPSACAAFSRGVTFLGGRMGRGVFIITLEYEVLRIFTKCASLLVARHHVDDFYSPPPHLPQQIEPHAIDIYGLIMAPGANHT